MKDSQSQKTCLFVGALFAAGLAATTPHAAAQDIPVAVRTVGGINAPTTLTAGDFNGDGAHDIAATDGSTTAHGFLSNGGQPPAFKGTNFLNSFNENNLYFGTEAYLGADLDGNGYDELIVGGWDWQAVGASSLNLSYYNFASDSYEKWNLPGPSSTDTQIMGFAAGDLDGDGDLDIVGITRDPSDFGATSNTVFWLENNSTGDVGAGAGGFWFTYRSIGVLAGSPVSVALGDVNQDGTLDIAVGVLNSVQVFLTDQDSPPQFTSLDPITGFDGFVHVALGDGDGDGDDDIFFATSGNSGAGWLRSDNGFPPSFTKQIVSSIKVFTAADVVAGDFDADGDIDFAAATRNGKGAAESVRWWENDGEEDTAFTERVLYNWGDGSNSNPSKLIAEDFDGDGDLDFAVTLYNLARVDWIENMTNPAPIITQQPVGQFVLPEATAVLSLVASGGATYQWSLNGKPLEDGKSVSGANSPSLSLIASAELEGVYSCVVSNPFSSTTSTPVVLGVQVEGNNDSCVVDLNNDGSLNFFDVSLFLQLFGMGCP